MGVQEMSIAYLLQYMFRDIAGLWLIMNDEPYD